MLTQLSYWIIGAPSGARDAASGGEGILDFFTASDGTRIAYRDEGSGTPLVLLHGLMAHGGFFRAQADLAAEFRVIAIDLRGHGASARPGERPTVEQLAAAGSALAEALDLE